MHHFLTTNQTEPPFVSALAYSLMMALLLLSVYASIKYHKNPSFIKSMKILQLCQLAILYSWYVGFQLPLANSLPLYHCRLAMFAVVFLPDKWPSKQYFALLGASGAVFALGYPVFDPYDFPHIFFPDWSLCTVGQFPDLSDESLRQDPAQEIYDCPLYFCA